MKLIMLVLAEREQKMAGGKQMSVPSALLPPPSSANCEGAFTPTMLLGFLTGGCNKVLHVPPMFGTTERTLNVLLFFGVCVLVQKCSSIQGMFSLFGSRPFHQDRIFSDHSV
jgi:hypothetical protein